MIRAGLKAVVLMGAGVGCLAIFDLIHSEITADPRRLGPGLIAQYRLEDQVWSLAFSGGDRYLASATITGEVAVKDLIDGHVVRLQRGPVSSVRSLAFSSQGRALAFANGGRAIRFWDEDSQVELDQLETGQLPDGRLTLSPDGELLAVGAWVSAERRRVVSVWDWKNGRPVAVLDVVSGGINALEFAPDGKQLAVGDSSGTVTLWDTARWCRVATFDAFRPGRGSISSLAFSPTGGLLATAGYFDSIVRIWNATTIELVATLPATSHVNALSFSPDGRLLATAQGDGFVGVWAHAMRRRVGSIPTAGRGLHSIAFSRDGRLLATGSFDGIVRLWDYRRVLDDLSRQLKTASLAR
jgi:WD40 repeat protein